MVLALLVIAFNTCSCLPDTSDLRFAECVRDCNSVFDACKTEAAGLPDETARALGVAECLSDWGACLQVCAEEAEAVLKDE